MTSEATFRDYIARQLSWEEAHAGFDRVIDGIPEEDRGRQVGHIPYSPWQLLEHLRITQWDILDFCRNSNYKEMHWPADYWPKSTAPASGTEWDESIRRFREDRAAMQQMAKDPKIDLGARIPHGDGQTYLREILLVTDHNAYHLGELVAVRRAQGNWKSG